MATRQEVPSGRDAFLLIDVAVNASLAAFATTINYRLSVDASPVREGSVSLAIGASGALSFVERVPISVDSVPLIDLEWAVGNALATATNGFASLRTAVVLT